MTITKARRAVPNVTITRARKAAMAVATISILVAVIILATGSIKVGPWVVVALAAMVVVIILDARSGVHRG